MQASALLANGGSQGAASEHGALNVQPTPACAFSESRALAVTTMQCNCLLNNRDS